jgi:hypothetical protein
MDWAFHEWRALSPEDRAYAYASRMALIGGLIDDAREHREAGPCSLAPLCPGRAAADKLISIDHEDLPDVLSSLVAYAVDQRAEIVELWAKVAEARHDLSLQLGAHSGHLQDLAAARKDADDGWRAYRGLLAEREQAEAAGHGG